jgi:hypothetical protein
VEDGGRRRRRRRRRRRWGERTMSSSLSWKFIYSLLLSSYTACY